MSGLFVVFEGIDGSGKSTQVTQTAEWLFNLNKRHHVTLTREPGRSEYGVRLREILGSETDPYQRSFELARLFIEDRVTHAQSLVRPALAYGGIVLCDRYKHSTLAFQGAQGLPIEELVAMHPADLPVPDLTLIFDLPVKEAVRRMGAADRKVTEMFERDPAFAEKLRSNYRNVQEFLPGEYIRVIDAARPVDVIQSDVRGLLLPYLNRVA